MQSLQPAGGETLRRQTSFAVICLKTNEKGYFDGRGVAVGGRMYQKAHQIVIHTLIARCVQGEENKRFEAGFQVYKYYPKRMCVAYFVTPLVAQR